MNEELNLVVKLRRELKSDFEYMREEVYQRWLSLDKRLQSKQLSLESELEKMMDDVSKTKMEVK